MAYTSPTITASSGTFAQLQTGGLNKQLELLITANSGFSQAQINEIRALVGHQIETPVHRAAQVVNASVSGETTSGGRTRLPTLLKQHRPTHVVIELGGNDALRGFPVRSTQDNLNAMVQASQAAGAKVLLVGMQVPPNYGKRYSDDFAAVFAQVAQERKAALVPFLLKGVADRSDARDWFQADGIHPLAKAHPVMLENVWSGLKPLL